MLAAQFILFPDAEIPDVFREVAELGSTRKQFVNGLFDRLLQIMKKRGVKAFVSAMGETACRWLL